MRLRFFSKQGIIYTNVIEVTKIAARTGQLQYTLHCKGILISWCWRRNIEDAKTYFRSYFKVKGRIAII
jgi:hypothetical protein